MEKENNTIPTVKSKEACLMFFSEKYWFNDGRKRITKP